MSSERWCPFCYGLNISRTWPHERATGCHSNYKATVSQIDVNLVEPLLHYIYIHMYIYIYIHNVKAVQPNSHLSHKWRNISRGQPYGHVPYKPPAFTKEHPVDMKTGARPDSLTVLGCRFLRTDRSNPRAATLEFLPLIDIKTKWPTFRMRHFIFFSLVEFPICYVSSGLNDYQSVSVQVRAWCWTGEKPLFGQVMASFTDIYKHPLFYYFSDKSFAGWVQLSAEAAWPPQSTASATLCAQTPRRLMIMIFLCGKFR